MRSRIVFVALSAGVTILLACADSTGPPTVEDPVLHALRWEEAPGPLQFAIVPGSGDGVAYSPVALPPLDRYEISFWATHGQTASVRINYRTAQGTWQPFLTFALDKTSLLLWPDGRVFKSGDKVLITVRVDSVDIRVRLAPIGLKFNPDSPPRFTLWYTGADPDLNGDGVVDDLDRLIERERLKLWTQTDPVQPWVPLDATHLVDSKQFITDLSGYAISFSGYAVSY